MHADFAVVDPASPPHLLETRTSTRSPFARDEFCETCGLGQSPFVVFALLGELLDLRSIAKNGCEIPN